MSERFLCIHGHFYQPPRENPWLESVEIQDSAYPYHDWNERITAECYAPNTATRNLDGEGRIMGIVSNYARISFNFGPTLLSWMEKHSPDTYRAIQAADRQSSAWRSGHGAALAQVYIYVSGSYLKGYLHEMNNSPLVPKDKTELAIMLRCFLIQKVVHDLGYELNNRPNQVDISLRGIGILLRECRCS